MAPLQVLSSSIINLLFYYQYYCILFYLVRPYQGPSARGLRDYGPGPGPALTCSIHTITKPTMGEEPFWFLPLAIHCSFGIYRSEPLDPY